MRTSRRDGRYRTRPVSRDDGETLFFFFLLFCIDLCQFSILLPSFPGFFFYDNLFIQLCVASLYSVLLCFI